MGVKLPGDIDIRDVSQWLSDGYVLVGGRVMAYIDHDDSMSGVFHDLETGDRVSHDVLDVTCYWPVCGAINVESSGRRLAIYVARDQARQWRRAFNGRCVHMQHLSRWAARKTLGEAESSYVLRLSHGMVRELFDPNYPSVAEAMADISTGRALSVAVSPTLSLLGDGKGVFAVYYRTTLVGGIVGGVFTPTIKNYYGTDLAIRTLDL
jgi:hypothetical protein